MVTEKTHSLFVVYRFYLAYNTVKFILKIHFFTISIQLEELRSSLNLKLHVKVKCLHQNENVLFGNTFQFYFQHFSIRACLLTFICLADKTLR